MSTSIPIEQWGRRLGDKIRDALAAGDVATALRLVRDGDGETRSLAKEFSLMVRGLGITIRVIAPLLAAAVDRHASDAIRADAALLLHRFRSDLARIARSALGADLPPDAPAGSLADECGQVDEALSAAEASFERAQSEAAAAVAEALEAGHVARARALLDDRERNQYLPLHDRLVRFMADSFGFVYVRCGAEALEELHLATAEGQRGGFTAWERLEPREFARVTAFLLKQHMSDLTVGEDSAKFTIRQRLCGSGGRLQTGGAYTGENALPMVTARGPLTFGEERLPVYCTHCPIWNGVAPVRWFGHPQWVFERPARPDGSCTLHIYKRPEDIPAAYVRMLEGAAPA